MIHNRCPILALFLTLIVCAFTSCGGGGGDDQGGDNNGSNNIVDPETARAVSDFVFNLGSVTGDSSDGISNSVEGSNSSSSNSRRLARFRVDGSLAFPCLVRGEVALDGDVDITDTEGNLPFLLNGNLSLVLTDCDGYSGVLNYIYSASLSQQSFNSSAALNGSVEDTVRDPNCLLSFNNLNYTFDVDFAQEPGAQNQRAAFVNGSASGQCGGGFASCSFNNLDLFDLRARRNACGGF